MFRKIVSGITDAAAPEHIFEITEQWLLNMGN